MGDAEEIVGQVEGHVPAAGAHRELLTQLLTLLRVPNFESVLVLLSALHRLGAAYPGLSAWPPRDGVFKLMTEIYKSPARGRFYSHPERRHFTHFTEGYGTFLAVLSFDPSPLPHTELLRAVLVTAAWQWRDNRPALSVLAQAVRGLPGRSVSRVSPLAKRLSALDVGIKTPTELARHLPEILPQEHSELSKVWSQHFIPLLLGTVNRVERAANAGAIETPGRPEKTERSSGRSESPKGRAVRRPAPLARPIALRSRSAPRQPGEPDADAVGTATVAAIPQRGTGLSRAREAFRAKQNIWSRNPLQLTEHIQSLTRREAGMVAPALCRRLANAIAANDPTEIRRWTWAALSFFTGRTPRVLASTRFRTERVAAARPSRSRSEIFLAEGVFRFPIAELDNAFVPLPSDRHQFEAVRSHLTLCLPQRLASLLHPLTALAADLEQSSAVDIKGAIAIACDQLADELSILVTPGRLRRTLGCLLQDEGPDIVSAMLISADTFGLSPAPLYYRAVLETDLQGMYARTTARVLGDTPVPPVADPHARIGVQNLLTKGARKRLGTCLGTDVHVGNAEIPREAGAALVHNALVEHLVGMILATAGHRPTNALFDLTRGDFDLAGNAALFQDKQFDLAHHCRFAAVPPILCRQVSAYLGHLRSLTAQFPKLERQVAGCLASESALLFGLSETLEIRSLSMAIWSQELPHAWRCIPLNFGRSLIATLTPEFGASPSAAAATLGHFESIGFPFSTDSPTEPLGLAQHLAPFLERLSREMGWLVRRGLGVQVEEDAWVEWGPLEDWTATGERAEKEARDLIARQRTEQRALLGSYDAEADALVLGLIADRAPQFAADLQEGRTRRRATTAVLDALPPEEVDAIGRELRTRAADDEPRALAYANSLSKWLHRARQWLRWAGDVPPKLRVFHRQETSPFFPGMLKARAHVEALREHFGNLARAVGPDSKSDLRTRDFAQCAMALATFGFIDDPDHLLGLLANRMTVTRTASLEDAVLVQWGPSANEVLGLRGIAAVSLAHLAKKYPAGCPPTPTALNESLASLMPKGATLSPSGLLARLCSTVSIANRIELSGAARLTLHPRRGAIPATLEEQRAFLDGDPVPALDATLLLGDPAQSGPEARGLAVKTRARGGQALSQYKRLLTAFPSHHRDSWLPRTAVKISQANREHSRSLLLAEMEAAAAAPETNNLVAALSAWCAKMLREGTIDEKNPALSTIHTYLTTVGSSLVVLAEQLILSELDEAELTQLYVDLIQMKKNENRRALVARELLHFHAVVAPLFGLTDIEPDEFTEYVNRSAQVADAQLIRVQEREAAMDLLIREAAFLEETSAATLDVDADTRRDLRQATVAMHLAGAAGARISEPLGMRLVDAAVSETDAVVRFASNRHRRVKTRAGRRTVDVTHRLGSEARRRIARWCHAERERTLVSERDAAFLFRSVERAKHLGRRDRIRDLVARSLALATGRRRERTHRLRHLAGAEGIAHVVLPAVDRQRVPFLAPLSDVLARFDDVVFPRDLHQQTCVVGHARPRTTLLTYFHVPWLARARADARLSARFDRWHAAAALTTSVNNADMIAKRRKPVPSPLAWLDYSLPPRTKQPSSDTCTSDPLQRPHSQLSTREVGELLRWTGTGVAATAAASAIGATDADLAKLNECAIRYAERVGRDLLSDDRAVGRSRVRRHEAAQHLYSLWDLADDPPDSSDLRRSLKHVVDAVWRWAHFHRRDRIALPPAEAACFRALLLHVGHPPDHIQVDGKAGGALAIVRVRRPQADGRYYGRELRRLLGVIWVRDQMLAESASGTDGADA